MNLQIRLAKSEDIEKIIELQSSSIRLMSLDYNPRQIESLVRSQASARLMPDEIVFLACYENEIVGLACLIVDYSLLSGLYVHPNFIRQGIGTQLLDILEKTAIEKECKAIYIISSLTAANFYQAKGYQVIRQSGFFSEPNTWIPCINLEKRLLSVTEIQGLKQQINYFHYWIKPFFGFIRLITLCLIGLLLPLIISLLVSLFL
ncbi:MAG TPA: GNAT family N-acetyltransferase [Coleofasciculaceae cyanobacterium]|jgi:putative acetyltransferase